jgi:hypothetical protein
VAGAVLDEFDRYEHRAGARAKWLATVLPSFDPYAALLVVHGDPAPMAVFAVEQGPLEPEEWPSIEVSPLEVPARWNDPVAQALREVRLFEAEPRDWATLDGIGYELEVSTGQLEAQLFMSNPESPATLELERRMFAAATDLSRQSLPLRRYLEIWNRYAYG